VRTEEGNASALSGAAFLSALVVNNLADRYVERVGELAHPNPDSILGLLPFLDLRFVYLWGAAAFIALALWTALFLERPRASYLARVYAALILVRSGLMVLTPMHIPAEALPLQGSALYDGAGRLFTARHDLFFSLHAALPFLGFLAFRTRAVRRACLGFSVLLAATVLLGRNHYSLDVGAAYFITYAVYRLEARFIEARLRGYNRIPLQQLDESSMGRPRASV